MSVPDNVAGGGGRRRERVERALAEVGHGEHDALARRVGPADQVGQILALEAVPPGPLSSSVPLPLTSMEK